MGARGAPGAAGIGTLPAEVARPEAIDALAAVDALAPVDAPPVDALAEADAPPVDAASVDAPPVDALASAAAADTGGVRGFELSRRDRTARWRTDDGRFEGRVDKMGLDTRYRSGAHGLHLGVAAREKTAVLGYERNGEPVVEAFRRPTGAEHTTGLRTRPRDLGDGRKLTPELLLDAPGGVRNVVGARYEKPGVTASLHAGPGAISLAGSYERPGTAISGRVARVDDEVRAAVAASHAIDPRTTINGSAELGEANLTAALAASRRIDDALLLSANLNHTAPRGGGAGLTSVALAEAYRGENVVHSASVTGTAGTVDGVTTNASLEAQLDRRLYGGVFGRHVKNHGHDHAGFLGASVTFTPMDKVALTLAGLVDQNGELELRLQLDVFKSKVDGIKSLSDQKRNALLSLFISYHDRDTGANGALGERFGEASKAWDGRDGTITGGIRIRF